MMTPEKFTVQKNSRNTAPEILVDASQIYNIQFNRCGIQKAS